MTINRSGSHGPQGPLPGDPRKALSTAPGPRATPAPKATAGAPASMPDQVQISAEAVALSAREEIPRGELPSPRLFEISQRIGTGHYNQPEALDATARSVLADLLRSENA